MHTNKLDLSTNARLTRQLVAQWEAADEFAASDRPASAMSAHWEAALTAGDLAHRGAIVLSIDEHRQAPS
jgi:hypothetical protein